MALLLVFPFGGLAQEQPEAANGIQAATGVSAGKLNRHGHQFIAYKKEEGLSNVIAWRRERKETAQPGRERYTKFAKALLTSGTPDNTCSKALAGCGESNLAGQRPTPLACKLLILRCGVGVFACISSE